MFKLDNTFLVELGLGTLPPAEKNRMLAHIYETLEMRVGMRLAEQMSNEQLDEFESYINRQDEAGALKWLETNFPDYKQVVADELEKLRSEIRQVAPQIVAQAQQSVPAAPNAATSQTMDGSMPNVPPTQPTYQTGSQPQVVNSVDYQLPSNMQQAQTSYQEPQPVNTDQFYTPGTTQNIPAPTVPVAPSSPQAQTPSFPSENPVQP